jgi:transcriptional regulator
MYVPGFMAVMDPAEQAAMLSALRLGCLVTHDAEGLFATHLPFVYRAEGHVLAGHIARANPHWRRAGEAEALVIFQGVEAYVSPNFYPTKRTQPRVVPTWNYEAVHIYGRLRWHSNEEWLLPLLDQLTAKFEADQAQPWSTRDAPESFIRQQAAAIVGVEIAIERIEAKRKLSQNRGEEDRQGVITGLTTSERPGDQEVAAAMASARPSPSNHQV